VQWKARDDGRIPDESYISHEDIKKNDPFVLVMYYEGIFA